MAKKKSRPQYTSKGERRSVSDATMKSMRVERRKDVAQTMLNKLAAWKKGKRVIVNGRVASDADVWGSPKRSFKIGS